MQVNNGHIKKQFPGFNHHLVLMLFICLVFTFLIGPAFAQNNTRQEILLNANWHTIADDNNIKAYPGFEQASFRDQSWKTVNVPNNCEDYEDYRRLKHGNRHG